MRPRFIFPSPFHFPPHSSLGMFLDYLMEHHAEGIDAVNIQLR
jgi:hypothetical protein